MAIDVRVTLERLAQAAALLAMSASLVASATLFFPWHTVDSAVPPSLRYLFRLANPVRAAGWDEGLEEHHFVTCTGLDHLAIGGWPIVILLASALLAGLAWRAKTARSNVWVSAGSVIMSAALAWLGMVVPLLRHLLEQEGPARLVEKVFDAALAAAGFCFLLGAALRAALLLTRRAGSTVASYETSRERRAR